MSPNEGNFAWRLNHDCMCSTTDRARLAAALPANGPASYAAMSMHAPHLFADTSVFIEPTHLDVMKATVAAVERVVALPEWQRAALGGKVSSSPDPRGVFFGFDFHITQYGPRLIEINTNAGGALLYAYLARVQEPCCETVRSPYPDLAEIEAAFLDMFHAEFRRARGEQSLRTVAIVDVAPESQFLYPEFVLFEKLFHSAGITTVVVSPEALSLEGERLWANGRELDLVYNRLTDFDFHEPKNQVLRTAWQQGHAVVTPHPRSHALYADKARLAWLSDSDWLVKIGAAPSDRLLLQEVVPKTIFVTPDNAKALWQDRRHWFFKPRDGFGSRGAYRGDKVTTGRWAEIVAGNYVAQQLVPPDERVVAVDGQPSKLKYDVRAFAYAGEVQLFATRLYQGQTTNMRTPGGGFAAVFERTGGDER